MIVIEIYKMDRYNNGSHFLSENNNLSRRSDSLTTRHDMRMKKLIRVQRHGSIIQMRKALKHVSITSSVVMLLIPATISVSTLSGTLVWTNAVLRGSRVVIGKGGVVMISEGTVGKTVMASTGSTCFVFSVEDSSFVVSDFGDSIDGSTAVEMLAVVVVSADVVVVVVLLAVVGSVVGATRVVVVLVVVVVEVVVDGDDVVSSVVVVCEIVSRCDVWHEKTNG